MRYPDTQFRLIDCKKLALGQMDAITRDYHARRWTPGTIECERNMEFMAERDRIAYLIQIARTHEHPPTHRQQ